MTSPPCAQRARQRPPAFGGPLPQPLELFSVWKGVCTRRHKLLQGSFSEEADFQEAVWGAGPSPRGAGSTIIRSWWKAQRKVTGCLQTVGPRVRNRVAFEEAAAAVQVPAERASLTR